MSSGDASEMAFTGTSEEAARRPLPSQGHHYLLNKTRAFLVSLVLVLLIEERRIKCSEPTPK